MPKKEPQMKRVTLPFSVAEHRDLTAAADDADKDLPEWSRLVLLHAAGRHHTLPADLLRAAEAGHALMAAAMGKIETDEAEPAEPPPLSPSFFQDAILSQPGECLIESVTVARGTLLITPPSFSAPPRPQRRLSIDHHAPELPGGEYERLHLEQGLQTSVPRKTWNKAREDFGRWQTCDGGVPRGTIAVFWCDQNNTSRVEFSHLESPLQKRAPMPDSLHEKIAHLLGWSMADVQSMSLRTLRELVRPLDKVIANALTEAIRKHEGSYR